MPVLRVAIMSTVDNVILDKDGLPFADIVVAKQVADVLSRETRGLYVVVRHDENGYGLLQERSGGVITQPSMQQGAVMSAGEVDFNEIRFRPAWRSQLGRMVSILLGLAIFLFADQLLGLLQIDRLLLLLQNQGLIGSAFTLSGYLSNGVSLIGLGFAGVAVLSAGFFIYSHDYFIGPRGIEENEGIYSKDQRRIEFKHIRGVNLRQSIVERLLGIGTLDVATSGGEESEVRFVGISNPKRCMAILRERLKALA